MYSLLIETSSERGLVAVLNKNEVLFSEELPFGLQNSKYLIPAIQKGLQETSLTIPNLSFIGVGIGPGSYTGMRIGFMTAKTLAYACNIPLVSLSSLQTYAYTGQEPFAVIVDAKISGVYLIKGLYSNHHVKWLSDPCVCPLDQLSEHLNRTKILISPNSSRLKNLPEFQHFHWQEMAPSSIQMNYETMKKFECGDYTSHVELLYLRKTQAELERLEHYHRASENTEKQ